LKKHFSPSHADIIGATESIPENWKNKPGFVVFLNAVGQPVKREACDHSHVIAHYKVEMKKADSKRLRNVMHNYKWTSSDAGGSDFTKRCKLDM
jgi:hypothetical protein